MSFLQRFLERVLRNNPSRMARTSFDDLDQDRLDAHLRVGRYGPYIEHDGQRASVPEGLAPDEITIAKALELLATASQAEEPLGLAADGTAVYLRTGRFGPYVQLGEDTGDKKNPPKRASLLRSRNCIASMAWL